jgi:hypothetical protein
MSSQHCSRAVGGWLAGCGAATAVLGIFTIAAMVASSGGDITRLVGPILAAVFPLFLTFLVICVLTGIPAAIVIWVSEKLRISSILFFGCTGGAIGGLSVELLWRGFAWRAPPPLIGVNLLFTVAGVAAGVAYWRVAGRYAGRERPLPGDTA